MKVIIFRGGQPGVVVNLPGDRPEVELEELLEGDAELWRLDGRYQLVVRADGEAARLPIRYAAHQMGREPEPVAGDCAVVAMGQDGVLRDITVADIPEVECIIRRCGTAGRGGRSCCAVHGVGGRMEPPTQNRE